MDWCEENGDNIASESSLWLSRDEVRSVKVRRDRSPVEGMMTEPLRSF